MAKLLEQVIVAGLVVQSCRGTAFQDAPGWWPNRSSEGSVGGGTGVVRALSAAGADADLLDVWWSGQATLGWAAGGGLEGVEPAAEPLTSESSQEDAGTESGQALLASAESGDIGAVMNLLGSGTDVEARGDIWPYQTPLIKAAEAGHQAVVGLLLQARASTERADRWEETPLIGAADKGHEAVVGLLLQARASTEKADHWKQTPLSKAAYDGHEAVVSLLLTARVSTESASKSELTPLYLAAVNGHEAVVGLLLSAGADTDQADNWKQTPLFRAAYTGHEAVVNLLLQARANTEMADYEDKTPLYGAADKGNEAIIGLLLQARANTETADNWTQTPLIKAVSKGHEAVVDLLLRAGASPDRADGDRRTPLNKAACDGHEAVVDLLLKAKANTDKADPWRQTPVYLAAYNGHEAVVDLLLEANTSTEKADSHERTPLYVASYEGHEAVVDLLLNARASTEKADDWRQTPLNRAAFKGHEAVVLKLVAARANIEATDEFGRTPLDLAKVDLALELCRNSSDLCEDLLVHASAGGDAIKASALVNAGVNPDNCGKSARDVASESVVGFLGPAPPPWQSCKARLFYGMVAASFAAFLLAMCLSCQGHPIVRWQTISSGVAASRGAENLALRSTYGAAPLLAAKLFRCLDVFVHVVLPMRLMHYICVPAWLLVVSAMYIPLHKHGEPWATAFTTVGHSIFLPPRGRPAAWWERPAARALRPVVMICVALLAHSFQGTERLVPLLLLNGHASDALSAMPHLQDNALCVPWFMPMGAWEGDGGCGVGADGCMTSSSDPAAQCVVTPRPFRNMLPRAACRGTFAKFWMDDRIRACPHGLVVSGRMNLTGGGTICPEGGVCMAVPVGLVWLALQWLGTAALALWCIAACCVLSRPAAPRAEVEELLDLASRIEDARDAYALGRVRVRGSSKKVKPVTQRFVQATVLHLALDVASDLNAAWTAFSSQHMYFGGILLGASLYSTGLEVGSGALFALPREVSHTLSKGVKTDGLLSFLEHESGNEALLSLLMSVYALPFTARTPWQMVFGALSICFSVWSMAGFQESYFDLRLPPPEGGDSQDEEAGDDDDDGDEDEDSEDAQEAEPL